MVTKPGGGEAGRCILLLIKFVAQNMHTKYVISILICIIYAVAPSKKACGRDIWRTVRRMVTKPGGGEAGRRILLLIKFVAQNMHTKYIISILICIIYAVAPRKIESEFGKLLLKVSFCFP
jgi:hypothetical protein